MDFLYFVFLLLTSRLVAASHRAADIDFNMNYRIGWGKEHVVSLNQGREVQLSMDEETGSVFGSKLTYGSGFFHMRIKIPGRNSAGVITAFYLTSHHSNHDELKFEFLGNNEGKPITLQTNVFTNGQTNRMQRINLWFDPTANFHTYKILWNQHQIVFYVDNIPIRVFKNNAYLGVSYPTRPMQILASLWNGDDSEEDGGQTKINWSYAPFIARFQGFSVAGCIQDRHAINDQHCHSSQYFWNTGKFLKLSSEQQRDYENVRAKYMTYDYCNDRQYHPVIPPECISNMQLTS